MLFKLLNLAMGAQIWNAQCVSLRIVMKLSFVVGVVTNSKSPAQNAGPETKLKTNFAMNVAVIYNLTKRLQLKY